MTCPQCGERMTGSYDGGEANDYALCVPACRACGYVDWDSTDEEEQIAIADALDQALGLTDEEEEEDDA